MNASGSYEERMSEKYGFVKGEKEVPTSNDKNTTEEQEGESLMIPISAWRLLSVN